MLKAQRIKDVPALVDTTMELLQSSGILLGDASKILRAAKGYSY